MQQPASPWLTIFRVLGDFRFWKLPLLVAGLVAVVVGNARTRRFLLLAVVCVLINDCVISSRLKEWTARPRPAAEAGAKANSFPSSHAVNVFTVATLATLTYGAPGAVAYVPATLVAVGRVAEGKHYPSDVVAGALLGLILAFGEFHAARCLRAWMRRAWQDRLQGSEATRRAWQAAGLALLVGATLARLVYIADAHYALAPDEAYYWTWSQRLAPSYYSKGAGIALQMAATTAIFGDTEFGIRVAPVLFSALIGALLWWETLRRRGPVQAFFVVLTLCLVPLFAAGSVLATIDAPLLACWTAALVIYSRIAESPGGPGRWAALGVVLGLGFLAKFSILLLVPGLLIHGVWSGMLRESRERKCLLLAGGVFLVFVIPFLAWNHAEGWPTVRHLVERGGLDSPGGLRLDRAAEFLGAQVGVVSPILWVMLFWGGWKEFRRHGCRDPWTGVLGWAAVPTLVLYALLSLRSRVQPNWTAPVYLSLVPLAVSWVHRRFVDAPERRGRLGVAVRAALVVAGVMTILVYRGDLLWRVGRDPSPRLMIQRRLLGWRELAEHVDRVRRELPNPDDAFVLGSKYQIAGELAFYCEGHPRADTTAPLSGRSQFDFWPGIETAPGADAVLVVPGIEGALGRKVAAEWFAAADERPPCVVEYKGREIERYLVFACRGYRGGAVGRPKRR